MNWKSINHPLGMPASTGIPVKKEIALGSLALGAAGFVSSLFGASASRKAAEEARRQQQEEKARLEAERLKAKNQSWLDTASGQNTMRILQDQARKFVKKAQGAAAVAGGTDAAVAMEKDLQNQKQADIIAQAEANHQDRRDLVDAQYRQEIARVDSNIQQSKMAEAEADAQVAAGASDALMAAGQALDEGGVLKGKEASTPKNIPDPKVSGTGSPAGGGVAPTELANKTLGAIEKGNQSSYWNNKPWMQTLSKSLQQNSKNYDTLLNKINDPMKNLTK